MRLRILYSIMALTMVGLFISPTPCHADRNKSIEFNGETVAPLPDSQPQVFEQTDEVTISSTGNRWIDDNGSEIWEYSAVIKAPSDTGISWVRQSEMTYEMNQEGISAMVSGTTAIIFIGSSYLRWTPQLTVGGVPYFAVGNPVMMDDTINTDYKDNVLQWDYGICKREMRATDGMVSENFIFDSNPSGDIVIDIGIDPTSTLDAGAVFAYDAMNNPIAMISAGGVKTVTQSAMADAVFPIRIDPTKQVKSETFDATLQNYLLTYGATNWSALWNGTTGAITFPTTNPIYTGTYNNWYYYGGYYNYNQSYIYRGVLCFNTTSLFGASIMNASIYAYATTVQNDNSSYHPPLGKAYIFRGINLSSAWDIPPDYPHNPKWIPGYWPPYGYWSVNLSASDYNHSNYITTQVIPPSEEILPCYLGRTATNVTTNSTWYEIPLNQDGIDIIKTDNASAAWTSFSLRIEREIYLNTSYNGSDRAQYFGGYQRVGWASGAGPTTTKPYLYVVYTAYAPPVPRTDTASRITMTGARINGYLYYDGGHQCRVGMRYRQVGATNWSLSSSYYGDIDNNGWVQSEDYDLLADYLSGGYLTADQLLRADVDRDGNVLSDDLTDIGAILAGGIDYNVYQVGNASTGSNFYKDLTGLNITTTYNFSSYAMHERFQIIGTTLNFTTLTVMGDPTELRAIPKAGTSSMILAWTPAGGSDATEVRYKAGSYPTDYTDGLRACRTAETAYTLSGLTGGIVYYFRAWGYSSDAGGTYSLNYSETFAGMPANTGGGGGGGLIPNEDKIPLQNTSDWFNSPQAARLSKIPGYAFINQMADAISMPYDTWWFLLTLGFCIVMGMFVFFRTNQMLLGFVTVLTLNIIFCMIGTMPVWITVIFSLSTLGFSWRELR